MQTIDDIISAHSVTVTVSAASSNPAMPQDCDDMDHWRCLISGDGIEGFEVHLSLDKGLGGGEPDLPTILEFIMADVRAYRDCNGYADFAALLGVEDGEPDEAVKLAWDELSRLDGIMAALEVMPSSAPSAP